MKHPACPSCQQDQYVIKSGLNRTGSQRYRCQQCHRYFTPDPKLEGYDQAMRVQALKLYLEGTSFRALGAALPNGEQLGHSSRYRPARSNCRYRLN